MTDDRSQVYQDTSDFLDNHGDGEAVLEAVLTVDRQEDTWEFDDLELDSGTFGEVVSAGVVEQVDGEYQLADQAAVEAVLAGEELEKEESAENGFDLEIDLDYTKAGGVLGALLVVFLARITQYSSVFQQGLVVSPGNDQYFYRYWMERLLADSSGVFDFSVVAGAPWNYGQTWNERPLSHATNWFVAELLGGNQWAANMVAAWLPIVMTIVLALIIYKLAIVLTDDTRVGIASILVLALAPVHVVYTQVGWLGNRPHQYLWFGLSLLTLVWLATDVTRKRENFDDEQGLREHIRSRNTWVLAFGLGIGLAFWTHSWGGSASFFIPLLGYVGLRVLMDVRENVSPGLANVSIVAGICLGTFIAVALHLAWDWHGLLAIGMAGIGAVGSVGLVGLGELWYRTEHSPKQLFLFQVGLGIVGVVILFLLRPEFASLIQDAFGRALSFDSGAQQSAQSQSLYTTDQAVILGPLVQIGATFYIGLATLGWCGRLVSRQYKPGWLVLVVFTAYYLIAAGIMVRFAGKLVIVMAVLSGLGFIYFLSVLDITTPPQVVSADATQSPSTKDDQSKDGLIASDSSLRDLSGYTLMIGILVFGLSLIFIPGLSGQATHDKVHVEATQAISDHAEASDREFPENHVFAPWGEYRMYNYFVNGEAKSEDIGRYGYSRIYSGTDTTQPYRYTNDRATGYVVVTDTPVESPNGSLYNRLYYNLSNSSAEFNAPDQYRLIHASDNGEILAYAVVPGANIEISGANGTVSIQRDISVSGYSLTFSRVVEPDGGTATATVPYPGEYDVNGRTVSIGEQAIENGETVKVEI